MSAICLIDTSVFVEILRVPGKATRPAEVLRALEERLATRREELFLPMATILETGNHIGQNGAALSGQSPFKPVSFLKADQLQAWLDEFPDHAGRGSGLADLSIIHDWQRLCDQNAGRRVYIWSLDDHLSGYDQPARL